MTESEIEERLRPWKATHAELTKAFDAFRELTGASHDSKLFRPVFDIFDAYTEAISELVGDREEWLKWYAYECDMGAKPMGVGSPGGREFEVQTLRDIAEVIVTESASQEGEHGR